MTIKFNYNLLICKDMRSPCLLPLIPEFSAVTHVLTAYHTGDYRPGERYMPAPDGWAVSCARIRWGPSPFAKPLCNGGCASVQYRTSGISP